MHGADRSPSPPQILWDSGEDIWCKGVPEPLMAASSKLAACEVVEDLAASDSIGAQEPLHAMQGFNGGTAPSASDLLAQGVEPLLRVVQTPGRLHGDRDFSTHEAPILAENMSGKALEVKVLSKGNSELRRSTVTPGGLLEAAQIHYGLAWSDDGRQMDDGDRAFHVGGVVLKDSGVAELYIRAWREGGGGDFEEWHIAISEKRADATIKLRKAVEDDTVVRTL